MIFPSYSIRLALCIIGLAFLFLEPSSAQQSSTKISFEKELNELLILHDLSDEFRKLGKYGEAYALLDSVLKTSSSQRSAKWNATIRTDLGVTCMYQGRYSDALDLFHQGLLLREVLNDSSDIAESYNHMASVHHAQTDHAIAAQYYQKSLLIREKLDDPKALGISYNNIGSLYEDMGEFKRALEFHAKSMNIWNELQDTSWIAVSIRHMGFCHQSQDSLNLALEDYLLGYQLSLKVGTRMNIIRSCMPIGDLYLMSGKLDSASKWCNRAYELSLEENNLYGIKESCWCLAQVNEQIGAPEKALNFYRTSIEARDSIFGHERTKELTRLEMSFGFEREQLADSLQFVKETELQEERIQRQRFGLMSTGAVTLMILVLAFVIYRGKRRSEHLLLNILPEQVAEELKDNGAAKAQLLDEATVLFTDFKGFTEIASQLSPEDLVAEIHQCFSAFDDIMDKYGVEKIKTIGDAYMAAGGVPSPKETHAKDVVGAALEIQRFMLTLADEKKKKGEPYFEVRIGINTGPVVAGIVGTKKFQYDIWGDTVNTASRMESSGKVGKVNISESTYRLVKDDFNCEYRGEVEAKGKGKVKMYFVS